MSTQSKTVPNVVEHPVSVTRTRREARNGHRGVILWLTGLSGSGKSTLAYSVEEVLHQHGCQTVVLDGAGHSLMSEQPDAVLDALIDFV